MPARWLTALVPAFLLTQAALVHFAVGKEWRPPAPALDRFPAEFNQWTELSDDPLDADTVRTLGADRVLNRTYHRRDSAQEVNLLVAWFQSQRAGASQPHSPKVCLPASGWQPVTTGLMTIDTAAGPITVNRYVVAKRRRRAVVLYWYQHSDRVVAGEWASKFWTVAGAFAERRTDLALVRVVVQSRRENGSAEMEGGALAAADLARDAYPLLRSELPR
jgi:EpsI family protein